MIVLKAETLELQGILYRISSKIQFQDKVFAKGETFSKRIFQQVVADLQDNYLNHQTAYLLIDMEESFTVWSEVKSSPSTLISASSLNNKTAEGLPSSLPQVEPAERTQETQEPSTALQNQSSPFQSAASSGETKATIEERQAPPSEWQPTPASDDVIEIQFSHQDITETISPSEAEPENLTALNPTVQIKYRGSTVEVPASHLILAENKQSDEAPPPEKKHLRKYRGNFY